MAANFGGVLVDLLFALTQSALRLCGESEVREVHRRDAENAKAAQRKAQIKTPPKFSLVSWFQLSALSQRALRLGGESSVAISPQSRRERRDLRREKLQIRALPLPAAA